MIGRMLLLGLFAVSAVAAVEGPSEFYVVSFVDHDGEGAWEYRILDVKQDGSDSLVRSILIAPVRLACPRRLTVRAVEARLSNVTPAQLTVSRNPCDGDRRSDDIGGNLRSVRSETFSRAAAVAKCGSEEKLGSLSNLGALAQRTVDGAFGPRDVFWGDSEGEDLKPQLQGDKLIPEITSGRFDKGLNAAFRDEASRTPRSFRDLLKDYAGVVSAREFVDRRLIAGNGYRVVKYVEPDYPPLGVAALVLGKVDLRLGIDPATGQVRNIMVIRGQAELAERASKAAQSWQFAPDSIKSESITVAVDFRFRCP
jgi:hypothetical protein